MKKEILNVIKKKIDRLIGKTIIQFGPPRSGTTLIYNILKDVFPNKSVETKHYYRNKDKRFPTIVTYRNPLDSITSSILRYKKKPTKDVIKQQISEFEKNGIWSVLEIRDNKNVLMLKYEDFVNNFDYIYNKLEIFFNVNISNDKKNLIKKNYNITAVEKMTSYMKSYEEQDKKNLFHGDHININKGQPNFYKEFLNAEQISYLKNIYKDYLLIFDYES